MFRLALEYVNESKRVNKRVIILLSGRLVTCSDYPSDSFVYHSIK